MKGTMGYTTCGCCGGNLPTVDDDNGHSLLPKRLVNGGECNGCVTEHGLCGAYAGWSPRRIRAYLARRGVRVEA